MSIQLDLENDVTLIHIEAYFQKFKMKLLILGI